MQQFTCSKVFWIPVVVLFAFSGPTPILAQDAADGILAGARALYDAAQSKPEDERIEDYRSVRKLLDLIVNDHPASDLAVRVLLQENIDGLDVGEIDEALSRSAQSVTEIEDQPIQGNNGAGDMEPRETGIAASASIFTSPPERPELEIVKEVQTELNRLGCGAGGADGVPGRKTRQAFNTFVLNTGIGLSMQDLPTEAAVLALKSYQEKVCSLRWVAKNRPERMAGGWGYRSDCPALFRRVQITGSFTARNNGGGNWSGPITNSLGQRGTFYSKASGNTVSSTIDIGGRRIQATYTASANNMTMSGSDTAGCKTVAWKN